MASAQVSRHGVTQTTHYRSDALGRRISMADAFGSTHYLWDGDLMVQSQRASGACQDSCRLIHARRGAFSSADAGAAMGSESLSTPFPGAPSTILQHPPP